MWIIDYLQSYYRTHQTAYTGQEADLVPGIALDSIQNEYVSLHFDQHVLKIQNNVLSPYEDQKRQIPHIDVDFTISYLAKTLSPDEHIKYANSLALLTNQLFEMLTVILFTDTRIVTSDNTKVKKMVTFIEWVLSRDLTLEIHVFRDQLTLIGRPRTPGEVVDIEEVEANSGGTVRDLGWFGQGGYIVTQEHPYQNLQEIQ